MLLSIAYYIPGVSNPSIQILKVYPTSAYLNFDFDGGLFPDKITMKFMDSTCKSKPTPPPPRFMKSPSTLIAVEDLVVDCTYRFVVSGSNTELNSTSDEVMVSFTTEAGTIFFISKMLYNSYKKYPLYDL